MTVEKAMKTKPKETSVSKTLRGIGISKNEAVLYELMLEHGDATVLRLQDISPFPRTMLYHVLNGLMRAGLVTSEKGSAKTVFSAESPDRIYALVSEHERECKKRAENAKAVVPELKNMHRLSQKRPGVRSFKGIEGYRRASESMLEAKPKEILTFAHPVLNSRPGVDVRNEMQEKRVKAGIKERILLPNDPMAAEWIAKKPENQNTMTDYRMVPKSMDSFDVDVRLYDGNVLITHHEKNEPVATVIEDENVYAMQRATFEYLWQRSS